MEDLNFNLIIVIVFLLMGVIRWVLEKVLVKIKPPPEPQPWEEFDYEEQESSSQPTSLKDLYDEARREILDRQNRPAPEPEVVLPQRNQPAPPPIPGKARINRPVPTPAPIVEKKKVQRRPVTAQQAKAAAAFEQHSKEDKRAASVAASGSRVRKLLASPTAARDAIVLAEILGKPKGSR